MKNKETGKVRSPCVNLCLLNDDDVCTGCYRTGEEITLWGRMDENEQRAVMMKVHKRESASLFVSK
ncbi:DUF1289 domain-containing protein [Marinomonas transparens]|uniref:DUF1289 domain-containing protein n=1 Tax=Marinomonas transparens TaxID=2795388 RepID=A0A934N288_9GAMM|nr:DUF1289 domain-containing protein [Marinomonas transparens]MBJ7538507.1 DUF1289 domain-containing protein [Marinomonas transparens]